MHPSRFLTLLTLLLALGMAGCSSCQPESAPPSAAPAAPATDAVAQKGAPAAPPLAEPGEWKNKPLGESPPVGSLLLISETGAGQWIACTAEEKLRATVGVRICPSSGLQPGRRCYTTSSSPRLDDLPLQLWVENDSLVRVVIRNPDYQTEERVGIGVILAKVLASYKDVAFLRGDGREWIAAVAGLHAHFYLDDTTSLKPEDIDIKTPITRVELNFPCGSDR